VKQACTSTYTTLASTQDPFSSPPLQPIAEISREEKKREKKKRER
jgi:hypothetical protein